MFLQSPRLLWVFAADQYRLEAQNRARNRHKYRPCLFQMAGPGDVLMGPGQHYRTLRRPLCGQQRLRFHGASTFSLLKKISLTDRRRHVRTYWQNVVAFSVSVSGRMFYHRVNNPLALEIHHKSRVVPLADGWLAYRAAGRLG